MSGITLSDIDKAGHHNDLVVAIALRKLPIMSADLVKYPENVLLATIVYQNWLIMHSLGYAARLHNTERLPV